MAESSPDLRALRGGSKLAPRAAGAPFDRLNGSDLGEKVRSRHSVNTLMLRAASRQSLTAVLDRLERRGWVERAKDKDDGRSRRIRLSPESKTIWARMHSAPSPRAARNRRVR
jgi:hypothetical protein